MGNLHHVSIWLCALALCYCGANAQRPANMSICDYYTTALLKDNTAVNQKTVMTLIVNTAIIGNYTKGNLLPFAVPGILAPGIYTDPTTGKDTSVNLLPYFTGALVSTNGGGASGVAVNFLDDGGAAPLMNNMPANSTSSNQYRLLTHLYEYFGSLLGCSQIGAPSFPAYTGAVSQYEVHKFMDLSNAQVGYFITQVAYAAASFGVASSDLQILGAALASTFGMRCAPAVTVIAAQGPQLQSICTDPNTCPISADAHCPDVNISPPNSASSLVSTGSSISRSTTGSSTSISTTGTAGLSTTGPTSASQQASATGSSSADSSSSTPNTLAIGLGTSLGVVLLLCIAGGIWFFIRRRRRRDTAAASGHTGGKPELEGTSTVLAPKAELDGGVAAARVMSHELGEGAEVRHELTSWPEGKAELEGRGVGS